LRPLSAAEAALHILDHVTIQPALRVHLDDALGAVLAEDVVSPLNIPAHTNSAMDGYAARSDDIAGASTDRPIRLRIVEHLPAGRFPTVALGPGECARIFTGSALPTGADCVVRQEDTDLGDPVVTVTDDRDAGRNVRQAGEDIRQATKVLSRGTALTPGHLGVLASMAVANPLVHRAPRIGILGSGDEIADIDHPHDILSGRKTASSNSHTLRALVCLAGGEPVDLGIAKDTPESLRQHIEHAAGCDVLVTSAGISVGEHDYVRQVLQEVGGDIDFWRLRMRPGAPVGFGRIGDMPWVGLPGNPVSAMVTFELFVRPAIRKMTGHRLCFRRAVPVHVTEPIRVSAALQHFLRAIVTPEAAGRTARLTGPQGSGILTSMIMANALLIVPEGQGETAAGAQLSAILLEDPVHRADPPFA
jgi:molybdopterin molybdotransferase